MTDLSTTYLGMELKNPLVCSASSLCRDLSALAEMEEAGASAVVLHSLFEEQIDIEGLDLDHFLEYGSEAYESAGKVEVSGSPPASEMTSSRSVSAIRSRMAEDFMTLVRSAKSAP